MKDIIEVLKRWNPWERELESGVRRKGYVERILPYMTRKEILVLKGIRRSGKSTLLKQIISEMIKQGVARTEILYLNLEDYAFADNLTIALFDEVLESYRGFSGNKGKVFFFIDEIQKIPSWEKWVRTKYDLKEPIKFVITGSSASLLSRELSTLLTGRNLSFTIMPLSFAEFKDFSKGGSIQEYMAFGGFPEVVLEKSEEKKRYILQQYFEDIIHKDIIDRFSIRNAKQLIDLARILVSTSGAKLSVNKLSKIFGLAKDTLQIYINYMLDAFLLYEVPYFSYSAKVRHDVSKLPKLYCLDNGIINISRVKYTKNLGQMFENSVLLKLAKTYDEVSYWGEGTSEVDFVVGNLAINVTGSDSISEREFKGLEDFKKKHRGFKGFIISPSLRKENIVALADFLEDRNIIS